MSTVLPEGVLYLVGTPIGNLGDLSPGVLDRLRSAGVVCAEDTRRTRKLLTAFDIHPSRLISVRAENEQGAIDRVMAWLAGGDDVVLVSDAGMPGLSDPGERLVRGVLGAGGRVAVEPGPDAATTALLVSGLPAQRFCFEGFLPRRGADREKRLAAIGAERRTSVLFESPTRLARTLGDLERHLGEDRLIAVANDLTKLFEKVWRGPIAEVRRSLSDLSVKGEFVVVVGPVEEVV